MRLRNKETGETGYLELEKGDDEKYTGLRVYKNDFMYKRYDSLAGVLEEWEDYKPAEPLIKDEKIRKAVRAWVEANDYGNDEEYQFEDFSTGWKSWSLEHKENGDDNEIHFNGGIDFEKMNHQGYYTIDELCGEEEG